MNSIEVMSNNGPARVNVDTYPDTCPMCGNPTISQFMTGYLTHKYLYLGFNCSRNNCGNYFLTEYDEDFRHNWFFIRFLTGHNFGKKISEEITKISPEFTRIYIESEFAFSQGLSQICGMGYRKALEFLIKDYIIHKNPTSSEMVKKMPLQQCIEKYIESPKIKSISERAAWLGNDESHYVRKWIDLDISHLRQLIDLTVHWIETEYLSDQLIELMADPKNKE